MDDALPDKDGEDWLPFRHFMISNMGRVFSQKQQKEICTNFEQKKPDGRRMYRSICWVDDGVKIQKKNVHNQLQTTLW